jgi:DNA-binding LacI/PurR family transcriptional regulator
MVRLSDVARAADVSPSAASVALDGMSSTTGLSEATRQRIREAAARLGYRPSPAATMLSTGRTRTIGLLLCKASAYLQHPDGGVNLDAMCDSADQLGYRILLLRLDHDALPDARLMDACVVLGWIDPSHTQGLAELAEKIPVVATDCRVPGTIPIRLNNVAGQAAEMAAEHLYDLGHRHIAVVDLLRKPGNAADGFRAVARRRGIEVRLDVFRDYWLERRYPTVEEICRLDPLPTAVCALDDDYARKLVARLARARLVVPEDVSVFSGETHRDGFQGVPPLTGVTTGQREIQAGIVRALIRMVEQDQDRAVTELRVQAPPPELIVRESCARPRGNGGDLQIG